MNMNYSWCKYSIVLTAILFVQLYLSAPSHACVDAVKPNILLEKLSSDMIDQINNNFDNIKKDPAIATKLIEEILLPHLDFMLASQKALVFEWGNLSDQQKKKFVLAFRIFLVRHSSVILASYLISKNKKLDADLIEFDDQIVTSGNIAKVNSKVLANSGKIYNVGYRLRCNNSSWKIYDVVINGVSIIKQYKGQFKYKIEKDGFESLIAFLNYKNNVMLAYGRS